MWRGGDCGGDDGVFAAGESVCACACSGRCLVRCFFFQRMRAHGWGSNGSYNVFHPVLDGTIIPMNPSIAMREGKFQRVPVIVGQVVSLVEWEEEVM